MQVIVRYTNVCEVNHQPHEEPNPETFEDVLDIWTDKDTGIIWLRLNGRIYELNRSCVLKMEVTI